MRRHLLIMVTLVAMAFIVFGQTVTYDFINYDDPIYVTENRYVTSGFTWKGIKWALGAHLLFHTSNADYWIPLTFLSHMLAFKISGLDPWAHHMMNVVLHAMNGVLLFYVLSRMTGAVWRSAFVAAMFLLHPLHVESVAWVTERKDVLSTFFWMLTILAYVRFAEHPASVKRYMVVMVALVLGLMAKPMLVTLPCVLLLLDWWPLGRYRMKGRYGAGGAVSSGYGGEKKYATERSWRFVMEKVPLFIVAALFCVTTIFAQLSLNSIRSPEEFTMSFKAVNALVSYVVYIGKMFYPSGLAIHYPLPSGELPTWQGVSAALVLIAILVLVIRAGRPYLIVGWLWYLGVLVPVIGLVHVGSQGMADRDTYVPLIGLFIVISWGGYELATRLQVQGAALAVCAGAVLLALTICSWLQVRYWRNSVTLFEHALDVTANNDLAHYNLAQALAEQDRLNEAIVHYSEAMRLKPDHPDAYNAHNGIGLALFRQGKTQEAISHYYEALRIKPDYAKGHNNLGTALAEQGRLNEALVHYSEALRVSPDYAKAHNGMGVALARLGRTNEAITCFNKALQVESDYAEAHYNLDIALRMEKGRNLRPGGVDIVVKEAAAF